MAEVAFILNFLSQLGVVQGISRTSQAPIHIYKDVYVSVGRDGNGGKFSDE